MLRLLAVIEQHGALDYRQAAALAGLSPHTVKNAGYVEALLKQRRIHVCGWLRSQSGPPRALFAAGQGEDVPRPTPLTSGEKNRAHRRRRLAASAATNFADQLRLLAG